MSVVSISAEQKGHGFSWNSRIRVQLRTSACSARGPSARRTGTASSGCAARMRRACGVRKAQRTRVRRRNERVCGATNACAAQRTCVRSDVGALILTIRLHDL
eukprot:1494779-Pleurochrysis_carterae.AAC.1